MEKNCSNCIYNGRPTYVDPCASCSLFSEWQDSKVTEARVAPVPPEVVAGREKGNLLHYPDSRHGDVISLCLNGDIGFCEGNIIKYVTRWRKKGGLEDLQKAKVYLDRLIRFNRNKDPQ